MNIQDLDFLKSPIKVGAILAMIISWSRNKSILMALVHGFFGWFYVIYYYFKKEENEQNEQNEQ